MVLKVAWSRGGYSGGTALNLILLTLPSTSLCCASVSVIVRLISEVDGEPPVGVGARESTGGGSYAIVVSDHFSWGISFAIFAPESAPQYIPSPSPIHSENNEMSDDVTSTPFMQDIPRAKGRMRPWSCLDIRPMN